MHKPVLGVLVACAVLCCRGAAADEESLAVDRALAVARFVAADAVFVAHVDVARVKVDAIFEPLSQLALDDDEVLDQTRETVSDSIAQFLAAGCQEAFLVMAPDWSPLLVVPLPPASDQATVLAILGQAPLETVEIIDGTVVAGSEASVARLRDGPPKVRPELAAAFAAAGDSAAQILILPTDTLRAAVDVFWAASEQPNGSQSADEAVDEAPKSDAPVGEPPSKSPVRKLTWAAVAIGGPDQTVLQIVLRAIDGRAATELRQIAERSLSELASLPAATEKLPNMAAVLSELAINAEHAEVRCKLTDLQLQNLLKKSAPSVEVTSNAAAVESK